MDKIKIITNGNVNMKTVQETTAENMNVDVEFDGPDENDLIEEGRPPESKTCTWCGEKIHGLPFHHFFEYCDEQCCESHIRSIK